jgi:hypothetical protein
MWFLNKNKTTNSTSNKRLKANNKTEWERYTITTATTSRATCKRCKHCINVGEVKVETKLLLHNTNKSDSDNNCHQSYNTHWECWHMPPNHVTFREERQAFSNDGMVIVEGENIATNTLIEIRAFIADAKPFETVQDFLWTKSGGTNSKKKTEN